MKCGADFRNISKRAAEMLQEDIEFMGPVRLRDVEEHSSACQHCPQIRRSRGNYYFAGW